MLNSRLEVFVCGPQGEHKTAEDERGPVTFRTATDKALSRVSADLLKECIARSQSDLVSFSGPAVAGKDEALQAATAAFQDEAVEAVLLPFDRPYSLPVTWRRYRSPLAVLIERPETNNVVIFRKSAFEAAEALGVTESPIWQWLVRTVFEGRKVVAARPVSRGDDGAEVGFEDEELPPLVPDSPDEQWLFSCLVDTNEDQLVPHAANRGDAIAVKAGLFQLHGFLDESHRLSQSVEGGGRHRAGDYWHAIMHRREPDYSNSKYWFRRVGRHPIFGPLARVADGVLSECSSSEAARWRRKLQVSDDWDAFAFVELCRQCASGTDAALRRAAERIGHAEMLLLMEQTYRDAGGSV